MLFQTISDKYLEHLIYIYLPKVDVNNISRCVHALAFLSYEEENAIRYIAGNVYHKLYQTISSGSDELHKRELLALNRILMNSNDIMMMGQMTGVDPLIEEH